MMIAPAMMFLWRTGTAAPHGASMPSAIQKRERRDTLTDRPHARFVDAHRSTSESIVTYITNISCNGK
jgi:hypothetical protein